MNAGVDLQYGMTMPVGVAVLFVCPDWLKTVPPGCDEYRMMNRGSYSLLPAGSHVVVGNEDDDDPNLDTDLTLQPPAVQAAYLAKYGNYTDANAWWSWDHVNELRKAWRLPLYTEMAAAGYVVHCAAEMPTERNKYDPATMALCSVIDIHVGVPEVAGKTQWQLAAWWAAIDGLAPGKPKWCTELEADPAYPDQMQAIPGVMATLLSLGFQKVFAWGSDPMRADINDHPDLMSDIRTLAANPPSITPTETTGVPTVADATSPSPDTLQQQNGLNAQGEYDLAQALIALTQDNKAQALDFLYGGSDAVPGPQSVFGQLNAISPNFVVPARPNS